MKNSSYKFKDNTHNFGQGTELSGSKKEKEGRTGVFREGDKVMQVKNNYKLEWEMQLFGSMEK